MQGTITIIMQSGWYPLQPPRLESASSDTFIHYDSCQVDSHHELMGYSIIIVGCQHRSGDTSARRKTSSSSAATLLKSSKPALSANASSSNTWSTSIPTSTRRRRNATGPTSPSGMGVTTQRVQLRRGPEESRLCLHDRQRPHHLAHLCQQGHGLVASRYIPPPLHLDQPHVIPFSPSLLQKHNKKLFDMCNLGEEFHFGSKRNEVLRECNRILDREDFWNWSSHNNSIPHLLIQPHTSPFIKLHATIQLHAKRTDIKKTLSTPALFYIFFSWLGLAS